MNTDLLKKKILDLAIKGKLVEQRPEEGTAEDLYQQIQEKKTNLIKEGKLKKEKPLAPIEDDEIPFDIPDSWRWVRIGDLYKHNTGKALNSSNIEGKKLPYITTSNLYWNRFELNNLKKMFFKESEIEKCSVQKGDLLVCEGGDIGRAAIWNFDYQVCIQNHIHKLRGYIQLSTLFYYYIFLYYKLNNSISGRGIGIQGLSSNALHNLVVPLPPLAEQKRIVEKIDLLFSRLHTVENGLVEIDKISDLTKKKILDLAIRGKLVKQRPEECTAEDLYLQIQEEKANLIKEGKLNKEKPLAPIENDDIPFDLPESWKWVRIRDISLLVTKGTTPRGGNVAYTDKGVGFLRAENVNGLTTLNLSNLKFVSEKAHQNELKRSVLEDGDILVTIAGTLGRTAVVQSTDLPLNANQAISIVRMIFKSENMLKYAVFALNANTIQQILLRQTKQTAIPNLTLEIVGNCIIPLPPLAEQKRIVAKVEELLALCDKLKLK